MSPRLVPTILLLTLSITCLLTVGLAAAPNGLVYQTEAEQAAQAIIVAQAAINNAFTQIAQANQAGAPITDLVTTLNNAIVDLQQARTAYNASNYASAILLAQTTQDVAENVSNEALNRRSAAQVATLTQTFLFVLVVVVVLVVMYLLITRWREYQRKRTRDLLRMEIRLPEEDTEDESHE